MSRIRIPGARDVAASLDEPPDNASACVVACPPHPEFGGNRSDRRLRAVGDALVDRGIACLRFDYGPWDEGRESRPAEATRDERTARAVSGGEREDVAAALDWATDRYERVGLFGYSFGGGVAARVAADRDDVGAASLLAPASDLPDGSDTARGVGAVNEPLLVVYGERDDTVEWEPVVEAARASGHAVESLPADHLFVGQHDRAAERVAEFLAGHSR